MKDDFHKRPPVEDFEADERAYRYIHEGMDAQERAALEADAAAQPDLAARVAAWAHARTTTRYLRMRPTPEGLRPELHVSSALDGYGTLELKTHRQRHRYAAGDARDLKQEFYQTLSEDGRLLLTLRQENARRWKLSARYAPYGRWSLLGEHYVLIQTPNEPVETPQCLLCILTQDEAGSPVRRYVAWFIPDAEASDCYVARLRLPAWKRPNAPTQLLFGVVEADAVRWLSEAERQASIEAAVDEESKRRW